MTVNPTAHGASHGSAGNDPIVFSNVVLGATGVLVLSERTEPANGAANTATIFAIDSGAGKTILKVRFASGASQTLATEP